MLASEVALMIDIGAGKSELWKIFMYVWTEEKHIKMYDTSKEAKNILNKLSVQIIHNYMQLQIYIIYIIITFQFY